MSQSSRHSTLFLSLKKTYLTLQHHGSLGQFSRNVLVSVAERMLARVPSRAELGPASQELRAKNRSIGG